MENSTMDILLTLISILGFAWVFLRLSLTVIPLQLEEAKVVNGLAKLRRRLLVLGLTSMGVALFGMLILSFSLIFPDYPHFMEIMVVMMVLLMVINAENKHGIYHEQYTAEHKELSRKIQQKLDKKRRS
jgi:CDP-diglyceride synthetase